MGGAKSHDVEDGTLDPKALEFETQLMMLRLLGRRRYRVLGYTWWPEELPSEEYVMARHSLEEHDWVVDYIITHCAPTDLALAINRHNKADHLTNFSPRDLGKSTVSLLAVWALPWQSVNRQEAYPALGTDCTGHIKSQQREVRYHRDIFSQVDKRKEGGALRPPVSRFFTDWS